jgi:hypothetical protein
MSEASIDPCVLDDIELFSDHALTQRFGRYKS